MLLRYEQNDFFKWETAVSRLDRQLKNDAANLQQVRIFIDQLATPFGLLQKEVEIAQKKVHAADLREREEEQKGDHKYF